MHFNFKSRNVYFVFTNEELKKLFDCSNTKIAKIKKELEGAHLLMQKRMGFQPKAGRQLPNRLYLAELKVNEKDVYLREKNLNSSQSLDTSRLPKNGNQHETVESLDTSRLPKNGNQHETVGNISQSLDTSRLPKNGHDLYKEPRSLDTNRYNIDTQKLDFSTAHFSPAEIQKQNQDLVNHANDFLTDEDSGLPVFLEPEAVQLLSFWCRTPQQMRRFIGIILNAKYRVEKDHQDIGVLIPLYDEELKPLMTKALRRYFNALRSNEKHIKNVENYLYGTMQNLFGVWWNKQAAREYAAKHPEEEKSADNDNSGLYY
ncbi:replication initiator protein A [Levilactobacillus brevis]|uniref:replication initiator protein A n=1 Tax=Levilactobacillus brevis TaxID=1580 RepID=UPI000572F5DD|nr:replication initiator protein A [Levilactobacillus brevis]AJA81558.1 plasmid replication initiation protein [Levilactobacillus brevis BSO 464]